MRRLLPFLCASLLLAGCPPCGSRPATRPFPRFDAHTHIGAADLPSAMQLYAGQGIVGLANFSGGYGRDLQLALQAARPYGGRVLVFANLSPRGVLQPGWVDFQLESLRRARQQGASGLKIYKALGLGFVDPEGQRVAVDDPRLDPIFEECGRLGLPVAIHTGDPKAFFRPPTPDNERYEELAANPGWSFAAPGFPSWEQLFAEYERRVARHPNTTFIGAHFGNDPEEPARVAAMLRRYPNLYVDTAARVPELGRQAPEALRAIFVEHRRRILFGTDFSYFDGEMTLGAPDGHAKTEADAVVFFSRHWRFFETDGRGLAHPTPIQGRWTVDALGLPEDVLHDLYHRNAERLFGLPPLDAGAGQLTAISPKL